jgi:RNA polymerase sigma-B factor
MRHYLRDKLNSIKVPAHIQELAYRINSFIGTLTQDELHSLTDDYVAEVLNVPKEVVNFARQADRRKETVSLDVIFSNDNQNNLGYEEVFSKDDYARSAEIEDAKLMLKDVIKQLPADCKDVIELYYYKDMTQKDIADMLNLSKMQVYRKLKKSFRLLYTLINGNKNIPAYGDNSEY